MPTCKVIAGVVHVVRGRACSSSFACTFLQITSLCTERTEACFAANSPNVTQPDLGPGFRIFSLPQSQRGGNEADRLLLRICGG